MATVEGDHDRADDEDGREDEDEEDGDDPIARYEKMRDEIQRERTVCFIDISNILLTVVLILGSKKT